MDISHLKQDPLYSGFRAVLKNVHQLQKMIQNIVLNYNVFKFYHHLGKVSRLQTNDVFVKQALTFHINGLLNLRPSA